MTTSHRQWPNEISAKVGEAGFIYLGRPGGRQGGRGGPGGLLGGQGGRQGPQGNR